MSNPPNKNIYLDSCASSPVNVDVIKKITNIYNQYWANPSSIHLEGMLATEVLERSRNLLASLFKAESNDIIFTSGATESINLALFGLLKNCKPSRIIISSVEHPAVLRCTEALSELGWDIAKINVDNYGVIDLDHFLSLIKVPTKLVSVIWGQNEVGSIQPIIEIGKICKHNGIYFHTDATQFSCQDYINWKEIPVDLLSTSSHKIGGPKGIGILMIQKDVRRNIQPLFHGGNQEFGLRSGTESVALAAGMSEAFKIAYKKSNCTNFELTHKLTLSLKKKLSKLEFLTLTGHPQKRLKQHLSYLIVDKNNNPISGREIVRRLSLLGYSISSSSACSSSKENESYVLKAMNIDRPLLNSGLRFSTGIWLKESDLTNLPEALNEALNMQ